MITGYSADALVFDPTSNSWSLRPDYDPLLHRVTFDITDDDAWLDGDDTADEVGSDADQTAVVRGMNGSLVAEGRVYDEEFFVLSAPGGGGSIWIERIEIGGVHVGYLVSAPLASGTSYNQTTTNDVYQNDDGDTRASYASFSNVPCFGPGAWLDTPAGPRRASDLRPGDLVRTLDHGPRPVLAASRTIVGPDRLQREPCLRPVRLSPGALGPEGPSAPLLLSPTHRVLIRSSRAALCFGAGEVLAPARALLGMDGVTSPIPEGAVTYTHLLFRRHEIVRACGLWVESFFAGDFGLAALDPADHAAFVHALRGRPEAVRAARPLLTMREAVSLLGEPAPA